MTCYFPECDIPVIVSVEGEPIVNVEIAHICGANPGSPRYDSTMTDDQRRSFANLLLLCKPHHNWIDRLHPDLFSPDLLQSWKTEREQGRLRAMGSLPTFTEDRLIELIEEAVTAAAPQRVLSVDLALGVFALGGLISVPPMGFRSWRRNNLDLGEPVIVVTARNQGALQAYVESYRLCFAPDGSKLIPTGHYVARNPPLPKRLDSGESAFWVTELDFVRHAITGLTAIKRAVENLTAEILLGSGESICSNDVIPVHTFMN
jgi:hypothetical protein